MRWIPILIAALLLATLAACGDVPPTGAPAAGTGEQPLTRETAVIRYQGMPGNDALPEAYGGRSWLDFETGLPRRTCGCCVIPGQIEKDKAHNARVRAACARGELRDFQLKHKFTPVADLRRRFEAEAGTVLAPGQPVETPDGEYRIDLRLQKNHDGTYEYWQAYVAARGSEPRRTGLSGKVSEAWRILFDHENTSLLVQKGSRQIEIHDLPTGEIVQVFYGP